MTQRRRTGPLSVIAAPPIGLGILKIYLHLISVWKFGFLDYVMAAGAILGGLFLFSRKRSKVTLLASGVFIAFEAFKAVVDYRDPFDVFIALFAIAYLSIPILKHMRTWLRTAVKEN